MTAAIALCGFRMGLYDDPRAGVLLLGKDQHLKEPRPVRARGRDRRITQGLVDHQHIAGIRRGVRGVKPAVFGQMRLRDALDGTARTVQQSRVIQRVAGQDVLKLGGLCRIEMQPLVIDQQPQRRLACATGKQRPQHRVFDADNG